MHTTVVLLVDHLKSKCHLASNLTLAAVAGLSRFWMRTMNRMTVINGDQLVNVVENRAPGQCLITVANHYSCMDDPLLWAILPWRILLSKPYLLRWTLAAREVVFLSPTHDRFFGWGRCVPVIRGLGVYQTAMERCLDVLNEGGWVHVFPEGKVNLTQERMRLKWGVGRLIADCQTTPIVLPMFHLGFDDVLPNVKPYRPRIGRKVTAVVGEPIVVQKTLDDLKQCQATAIQRRLALTEIVQEKMTVLKTLAEQVHYAK